MLVVEDLQFGFRHRPLIRNLSFSLNPGQLMHLQGPNGCGKTTLLNLLTGLYQPGGGRIRLLDGEQELDPPRHREYLASESNGLYGKLDAMTNLRFWSSLRGRYPDEQALIGELAAWKLDHPLVRSGFPVERFSTGMKRRLALARLNLSGTRLWLLDEPLNGLDPGGISAFEQGLRRHLDHQGMAIMVSHDASVFRNFAPVELSPNGETS